jgi:hypothetical protein
MIWENTLMAHEEDIKSRSFWDWIKAHTSFMKPLHRYQGTLKIIDNKIIFSGKDIKEDGDLFLEISTADIADINLGYDDVFTGWEDRASPWNKPLRIISRTKEGENTIYLFANFHHKNGMRSSDNKEVFERLMGAMG